MAKVGRPCKLTPELQARICEALAGGNTRTDAVRAAAIDYGTFCRWMRMGRSEDSGAFFELSQAVKKAEADAALANVRVIQEAAKRHWQAAAWWLERKYPELWGSDRRRIAELEKEFRELRKRLGGDGDTPTGQGA